jgi:hypothetical protein
MAKSVERNIKAGTGLSKTGSTISILPSSSVSFNSQKITNLATPTADADAATKAYVDTQVGVVTTQSGASASRAFVTFLA